VTQHAPTSAAKFLVFASLLNDQLAARYTTNRLLRRHGFNVVDAEGGRQALELARRHLRPDVIVLDGILPDLDGIEVCRRLKADPETASIKVLLTSATSISSHRRVVGLDAGGEGIWSCLRSARSWSPTFVRWHAWGPRSSPSVDAALS
jgi:CheY-like chemotaxis protein